MITNNSISEFVDLLRDKISEKSFDPIEKEIGTVVSIADGTVKILGMYNAFLGEIIKFDGDSIGIVLNLNYDSVDCILFDDNSKVKTGSLAYRTKKGLEIPVGEELLGRVVDPLGRPLDGMGQIFAKEKMTLESNVPGILDRKSVHEPLETGILSIDATIPIGRGQRELIIGNRQTGKTSIAIDAIINQARLNHSRTKKTEKVFSIYVAIGQKLSTVAQIVEKLKANNALSSTIIVVASASDAIPFQYIAPYSGATFGRYFRDNGMHALVVYDDLTKHAIAYREISLLLKRPPAREAYPGDVFYLHSKLLESAAKLSDERGGGSMTALPIIETHGGDISAYIPTNVISITDGQIFLETDLFFKGFKPAINIGFSVSRIGSAAQTKAMKKVAGKLKIELAQFRELEDFARFGSDLDDSTLKILEYGNRLSKLLIQEELNPKSLSEQVITLYLATNGFLKDVKVDEVHSFVKNVIHYIRTKHSNIIKIIEDTKDLTKDISEKIDESVKEMLALQ